VQAAADQDESDVQDKSVVANAPEVSFSTTITGASGRSSSQLSQVCNKPKGTKVCGEMERAGRTSLTTCIRKNRKRRWGRMIKSKKEQARKLQIDARTPCPYISSKSKRRECTKMIEAGLSEEISDLDYERYCNGNPFYCYYFRKSEEKTKALKKKHP